MSLLDRIFQEPELKAAPPVLVDVGAAGGVAPIWRSIARYAIGVGFEPDERDAGKLRGANRAFGRWIHCEGLVAPAVDGTGRRMFHFTRSPHCSSLLKPRHDLLRDWLFADFFAVQSTAPVPAVVLSDALQARGLDRIDWLKCDTQGQDLSIFLSLPEAWRRRVLAVEFEPGLIDAYEGEDKFWHTLRAMEEQPFWISDLQVCGTQRGEAELLRRLLGPRAERWVRRLAPTAPGWVNVRYLRRLPGAGEPSDRRDLLLAWVFADLLGQHAHALTVAHDGRERFGGELFDRMLARSRRRLFWAMLPGVPGMVWRRLGFGS
ncbi:MAG: FkbM family methyltransferase [Opitutaceae bacterium]|nr:FkbM family methyltransferase [Opitutaceae bacterium]